MSMRRLSYTEQRKLEEYLAGLPTETIDKRTLPQLARIATEAIGVEIKSTNVAFMLKHLGITKRMGHNGRQTKVARLEQQVQELAAVVETLFRDVNPFKTVPKIVTTLVSTQSGNNT